MQKNLDRVRDPSWVGSHLAPLKGWSVFIIKRREEKSLNFLGDEYDDLNASCKDTKQLISRLSTRLSRLSEKVELLAKQIEEPKNTAILSMSSS